MRIFCHQCQAIITGQFRLGEAIYPHRPDLRKKVFWQCPTCQNYVGTHPSYNHHPLGSIPTPELRKARRRIHEVLDPLHLEGKITRSALYARLSYELGYPYHTAQINSLEEVAQIIRYLHAIQKELSSQAAPS